ncbi:MAG: hypothetical protein HQ521_12280, partial [Bacteroidetes bacterium]|nr:hypothetical protein [Bacteroidota bacterium]
MKKIIIFLSILLLSCEYNNPYDVQVKLPNFQTGLQLTANSDSQVSIEWNNLDNIKEYVLTRIDTTNAETTKEYVISNEINEFIDNGLTVNTPYTYSLFGRADENVTNTISNSIVTSFPSIQYLNSQITSATIVSLEWEYDCDFEEGFIIDFKLNSNDYSTIDTLETDTQSFEYAVSIVEDSQYFFRIKAYSQFNESEYTENALTEIPVIEIPQIIHLDEDFGSTMINLSQVFTGIEDESITYTVEPQSNIFNLDPSQLSSGLITIESILDSCSDNDEISVIDLHADVNDVMEYHSTLQIIVHCINDPPVINSTPPTEARTGILYQYNIVANDVDSPVLNYQFTNTNIPNGMVLVLPSNYITWIPQVNTYYNTNISIIVCDQDNSCDIQEFTINVIQIDCNNIDYGTAFFDDCDDCVGGDTGFLENYADQGCGCDEPAALNYCENTDGDEYGNPGTDTSYCLQDLPEGWVANCSDLEPDCATNDTDVCGVCGGSGMTTYYSDTDSDNFGDPGNTLTDCDIPTGYVLNSDDCDDGNSNINPDVTDDNCDGVDNDCNDIADDSFTISQSTCGVGVCSATGSLECIDGAEVDSCVEGSPTDLDDDCNGIDEDCSGTADDNYVAPATDCGLGVCYATGILECVSGGTVDTCVEGSQTGNDDNCNGIDENCNGIA